MCTELNSDKSYRRHVLPILRVSCPLLGNTKIYQPIFCSALLDPRTDLTAKLHQNSLSSEQVKWKNIADKLYSCIRWDSKTKNKIYVQCQPIMLWSVITNVYVSSYYHTQITDVKHIPDRWRGSSSVRLLEWDEILGISLSVVEDDEYGRACFIVNDRVITTCSTTGWRLRWRNNHGLATFDKLASQHQWLVDVLGAVSIWRRVRCVSGIWEITCKVHTSSVRRRWTATTQLLVVVIMTLQIS